MNYNSDFYDDINSGATRSATQVVPLLIADLNISSVLDVGCGEAAWLAVWESLGASDVFGIDGNYVERDRLLIGRDKFKGHDLSKKFNLNRSFDLVQSLEVAEHLPETSSADFVESLVAHGDLILFSAAPKGQGGSHHVNEQSYNYWRLLFARHDFVAIDYLRPLILKNLNVKQWYRYNICLYASKKRLQTMPAYIQSCAVPPNQGIKDLSPFIYRVKKVFKRILPRQVLKSYLYFRRS